MCRNLLPWQQTIIRCFDNRHVQTLHINNGSRVLLHAESWPGLVTCTSLNFVYLLVGGELGFCARTGPSASVSKWVKGISTSVISVYRSYDRHAAVQQQCTAAKDLN